MRYTAAVALVLLTACSRDASKDSTMITPDRTADGGPVDPNKPNPSMAGADTQISGTRLKRRVLKGADGSQQFLGWFDTQRNEACNFQDAADGKQRCLPLSTFTGGYYSDPACTNPIVTQTKGCAAPATAFHYAGIAGCPLANPVRVLQIAGTFTGATVYSGAGCTGSSTAALLSTFDVYETSSEIPPTSFVDATEDHI